MQGALQRTPSNGDTAMLTSSTVPERDPIDRLTSGSGGTVGTPETLTGSSTAGRNSSASRREPPLRGTQLETETLISEEGSAAKPVPLGLCARLRNRGKLPTFDQ